MNYNRDYNDELYEQPIISEQTLGDDTLAGARGAGGITGAGVGALIGAVAGGLPTFGTAAVVGLALGGLIGGVSGVAIGILIAHAASKTTND